MPPRRQLFQSTLRSRLEHRLQERTLGSILAELAFDLNRLAEVYQQTIVDLCSRKVVYKFDLIILSQNVQDCGFLLRGGQAIAPIAGSSAEMHHCVDTHVIKFRVPSVVQGIRESG